MKPIDILLKNLVKKMIEPPKTPDFDRNFEEEKILKAFVQSKKILKLSPATI